MADVEQATSSLSAPTDHDVIASIFGEEEQQDNRMETAEPAVPVWNEITGEFFAAVKDLKLGELVHHEIFGLFEAMSAIEMMDPKMDAGMCCNKNTDTPLTFDTALSSNKLKLIDLSAAETIGIMDALWSCLVSWLEGHSSAQTLFTCLYLHQPHQIKDRPLRAFCLGMRKLFQVMRQIIMRAEVYEEEDFEMRDYEFDLQPKVTDERACFLLKEAEEQLQKRSKQQQQQQQQSTASTPASSATAATTTPTDTAAVCSRLRFMRTTLEALVAIWPSENLAPNKAEMHDIQKLLTTALDALPTIRASIPLGTQAADGADEPNPMGFSPLVNQRMLPPTFPRFTKIKERPAAVAFLEQMLQRVRTVCNVLKLHTYHAALNFFIDFSRNAAPCLLSRAVLQTLYFPVPRYRFGVTHFGEVLRDAMRTFVSPPVLTTRHPLAANLTAMHCFVVFVDYCSTMYPFVAFVQLCGFNKARQRDKLVRLLADLSNVGEEAERIDAYMQQLFVKDHSQTAVAAAAMTPPGAVDMQPYFGTWMLYHSLRAMHMYLLAGVELELYAQHEYVYVYWYLAQFLCQWMTTTLSRADQLGELSRGIALRWPAPAAIASGSGGGGGKASKKDKSDKADKAGGGAAGSSGSSAGGNHLSAAQSAEQRRREWNPYYREQVLNQAHSNLYSGFYKAMVAFDRDGRIQQPLSAFDSEKVRFEHRFAPFASHASLPPVPYEEFAAQRAFLVAEHETVDGLYAEAAKSFQRARMLLETLTGTAGAAAGATAIVVGTDQEIADIIRVTKVNLIVMNLMARGHMKDTKTQPTFDYGTHKFYPTIRIQ